jgi:DNA repair protein RecO (recombination protein O)
MLTQTLGIVLHQIKYGESDIITHIYTEALGRQSFIVRSARKHKSAIKANLFTPLNILDLIIDTKEKRDLHYIKECRIYYPLFHLQTDFRKQTLACFYAEVLFRLIKEQSVNKKLFNHLTINILELNDAKEKLGIYPLIFLLKLLEHLGIQPYNNFSATENIFDLKQGYFVSNQLKNKNCLDTDLSKSMAILLQSIAINNIPMYNKNTRNSLIDSILQFINLHFEGVGQIKSFPIFKEIFHDT